MAEEDRKHAGDAPMEWVTVEEAACRLGIEKDSVKKQAKRGRYRYKRNERGHITHVYLETLTASEEEPGAGEVQPRIPAQEPSSEVQFLREELVRLTDILITLTQRIPKPEPPSSTE